MKYNMPGDDELGSAISLEDALSIMVVVFVIFLILFIPLVNMDRANLERSQKLDVWRRVHEYLVENEEASSRGQEYSNIFEQVGNATNRVTRVNRQLTYLESVEGNNLLVVEHNTRTEKFISMYIQNFASTISYREGTIKWDNFDRKWFSLGEEISGFDATPAWEGMRDRYKKWIAETRGIVEDKEVVTQEEG